MQAILQNDPNTINFMNVYANSAINQWVNISYECNTCNKSILSNNRFFNLSDFFAETKNNNLNFDKFIMNCKAISYKSCLNISKKLSDVEDLSIKYNIDKFIIKHTPKKVQVELQTLSSLVHIN